MILNNYKLKNEKSQVCGVITSFNSNFVYGRIFKIKMKFEQLSNYYGQILCPTTKFLQLEEDTRQLNHLSQLQVL